jgi:hypothetical protein
MDSIKPDLINSKISDNEQPNTTMNNEILRPQICIPSNTTISSQTADIITDTKLNDQVFIFINIFLIII